MIEPGIYSTISSESVEQLAFVLARRDLTAIKRFQPIAEFEELISFTTENPTPVEHANRNPVWSLESVSARLFEAVAISVHEPTIRDAGWRVLARIILEHTEYLFTYHHSQNPRERLQAGAALALASSLCPNLSQSGAWRLAGFARIAESITNIEDVPAYLNEHIHAAFELACLLDLPIFGEAIDRYATTLRCDFSWDKRMRFELSDVELFNHLNLRHPGFEKVKFEWECGNLQKAKIAHTSVKQSLLNCRNGQELWKSPLRRSVVDSRPRSDKFPDSDALDQKRSAGVSGRFVFERSRHFFDRPPYAESCGAMSFDMSKSYLERARYLSAYQGLDKSDFHSETGTIGIAALLFPEWKDREQYLKLALRRYKWIHEDHILPDGLQNDSLTAAHHFALTCMLSFYQLACLCGMPLPKHFIRRCEMMVEALMYLSPPDTSLHPLDDFDSANMSVSELCGIAHAVFNREDFLYIASSGAAGQPPNETSHAFPYRGYYVMRDYWNANAHYLVFNSGGSTARNQCGDKLNFFLYAYGRPLIVDAGGFLTGGALVEDCNSSRKQNTVIIDGKGQYRPALRRAAPVPNPDINWLSTPSFDFVEGWHKDGYVQADLSDHKPLLHHKRSIFFVKGNVQSRCSVPADGGYFILHDLILGNGKHTLEQVFHLASVSRSCVKIYDNNTVCTAESNVSNLMVAPVSDAQHLSVRLQRRETESLVAPTVNELTYAAKRTLPTVMNTVLFPLDPGMETVPEFRTNEVFTDPDVFATGFTVTRDRITDFVLISDDGYAAMSTTDLEFVGEYLFLRLDDKGKHQRVMIINGQYLKWRGNVLVELPEPRTYYESSTCGE